MKKSSLISFNFVPFPLGIWDEDIDLSLGEFRLIGYLLRLTYRFGKSSQIRLSDDELMHGRKAKTGERVDKGCGLKNRSSIRAARKALIARGWILFEEDGSDRARIKRFYTIKLSPEEDTPHVEISPENDENEDWPDDESSINSGVIESDSRVIDSISLNDKSGTELTKTTNQGDGFHHPNLRNPSPDQTREGIQEKVLRHKNLTSVAHATDGAVSREQAASPPEDSTQFYLTKKGKRLVGAELEQFTDFIQAFDFREGLAGIADDWHDMQTKTPEALRLARLLSESIRFNFPNVNRVTPPALKTWVKEFDLLHRKDGHDWQIIENVLQWCQRDEFWRQQILSGPTFRRQWDKLVAKYQNTGVARHKKSITDIEAIVAEMGESDGKAAGDFGRSGTIEAEFQSVLSPDEPD